MRFRKHIAILSLLLSILPATGSPARRGLMRLMQPDGSTFTAVFKGDEFTRIKTTPDGNAIIQDNDGWWCYAVYNEDGSRESSGLKVGQELPSPIIGRSAAPAQETVAARNRRAVHNSLTRSARMEYGSETEVPTARHGIVILAQFQDIRFVNTKKDFEDMLMQRGYNLYGATGSAKDYFDAQFDGRLEFSFEVSDIVTLSGKREYYGKNDAYGNDARPEEMIIDACRMAAENGVDFSMYDDDNDGFVDNVFVFFAGEDEAEGADENSIWSHAWYIYSGAGKALQLNGKIIDRYACSAEMTRIYDSNGKHLESRLSGIGTFCHEYCHTFGLPDLYDTDYDKTGGWAAGLWGRTSIMDSGNQNNNGNTPPNFNALERELLGLSAPKPISKDGIYHMDPIHLSGQYYRMETDREGEYYLFECRTDEDGEWDSHIGGNGMLVYHIDMSENVADKWTSYNSVNSDGSHQCADLVEADGRKDIFSDVTDMLAKRQNISSIFFPYGKTNSLTPGSSPGLKFWSGAEGQFSVTDITRKSNGSISFRVIGGSEETTPPSVRNTINHEVFYDGAIISFESSRPHDGEAIVRYGRTDQEDTTAIVVQPYENGKYSVVLEGLEPARTYTVNISFSVNGIEGNARSISFMTKKRPSVRWPYIFFGNTRRNSNGTFLYDSKIPLKVYNASHARQITWTFNDKEISAEGNNYFSLPGSGILKVHIIWEDGSEEILMKEINIAPMTVE